MSKAYEAEQTGNKRKIAELSEQVKSEEKQTDMTKAFLEVVDRTTQLETLTADVVREFIEKIVVHHRKTEDSVTTQKIEIFYNVIGKFEIPSQYKIPSVSSMTEAKRLMSLNTPA